MKLTRKNWMLLSLEAAVLCVPAAFFSFLCGQDPGQGGEWVFGHARLVRPDPPVDEDARGFVHLHQRGDRKAVHVHVWRLDPGATYDVTATRNAAAGGTETETIGSITTRGPQDAQPPHFFLAKLSGRQEVPPVETRAFGFGFFHLNTDSTKLSYHIFVRGLSGPATAAHIHLGAPGEDGPVVHPLDEKTLKGEVDVTAEDVAHLAAGEFYANVHTEKNPDGEIRGQIKPITFPLSFAKLLEGSGALRLDSAQGDKMPFDVASLKDLVGVTFSVLNSEKKVVLSGTIEKVFSLGGDVGPGVAVPLEAENDEESLALAGSEEPFFGMEDPHDEGFLRGDVNDDGHFDIADPISVLGYLFLGNASPYCQDAADANDNGRIEMADAVLMLRSLFQSDVPLVAPPFPGKGFDTTPDQLFCGGAGGTGS